jgi:predicted Rdx family selenoprotein
LGEVALVPATGGVFIVEIVYSPAAVADPESSESSESSKVLKKVLWDRKAEGGFCGTYMAKLIYSLCLLSFLLIAYYTCALIETKELKRRVRDVIQPERDLGHVDGKKATKAPSVGVKAPTGDKKLDADGNVCEDCR